MLNKAKLQELITTVKEMVSSGKGLLAADESFPTIEKRFAKIGVPSTEENRRAYREMLFTTNGISQFISGVILFDETIRQKSSDGIPFAEVLVKAGIIPGIKVDKGTKSLANSPLEKITEGLDGLRERLVEYKKLGARFAKWRAVITIGGNIPTDYCIYTSAHILARYAGICQEQGIVPIIEPEVLMDGSHSIDRCEEESAKTLKMVFDEIYKQKVVLEGLILKTNMVISGSDAENQAGSKEVAEFTLRALRRFVPAAVGGIVFLSGGQSEKLATLNLNEINKAKGLPWELSFSYGRALQDSVLKTWQGRAENVKAAQKVFYHRAKLNSAARQGIYSQEMEQNI